MAVTMASLPLEITTLEMITIPWLWQIVTIAPWHNNVMVTRTRFKPACTHHHAYNCLVLFWEPVWVWEKAFNSLITESWWPVGLITEGESSILLYTRLVSREVIKHEGFIRAGGQTHRIQGLSDRETYTQNTVPYGRLELQDIHYFVDRGIERQNTGPCWTQKRIHRMRGHNRAHTHNLVNITY